MFEKLLASVMSLFCKWKVYRAGKPMFVWEPAKHSHTHTHTHTHTHACTRHRHHQHHSPASINWSASHSHLLVGTVKTDCGLFLWAWALSHPVIPSTDPQQSSPNWETSILSHSASVSKFPTDMNLRDLIPEIGITQIMLFLKYF